MKYAIVESGGKQYKAVIGGFIEVDRLPQQEGDKVEFDALLYADDDHVRVGTPHVEGVKVITGVVEHFKANKLIVFKYKPKKRYRNKRGHRQVYTRLSVEDIRVKGK